MTAEDDANSGEAGDPIIGGLMINDIDPDGSDMTPTISMILADTDGDGVVDNNLIIGGPPVDIYGEDPNNTGTYIVAGTLQVDASGNYTFISDQNFEGTVQFPYEACDNDSVLNACDEATLYLTIKGINTTVAEDDINQTLLDVSVSGDVSTNDYDAEGDIQTVTGLFGDTDGDGVSDNPLLVGVESAVIYGPDETGAIVAAGTILLNTDGTYTFDPNDMFTGTVEIAYVVTDDNTDPLMDPAVLTIDVIGDNGAGMFSPIAPDDNGTMQLGVAITINILSNDSDPDGTIDSTTVDLDASSIPGATCTDTDVEGDCIEVTVPGEGVWSVDPITGAVTFTPEVGYMGNPTPIVYSVDDNDGLSDSAVITIVIEDPLTNEMTAEDDGNSGVSGNELIGNVLDNDIDPEDPMNLALPIVSPERPYGPVGLDGSYGAIDVGVATPVYGEDPNNAGSYIVAGVLTLSSDGSYRYESDQAFEGTISIPYEACDNEVDNACDMATLYLTTYRLPDLTPGIVVDIATIDEGGLVNIVYNYTNLGPSVTDGSEIEFRIFKLTTFGTITLAPVPAEWTLTDEGNFYSLKSNEIIRVGVGERVSFDAVFQHDGDDENGIIELTTDIIFGSGGETKITNNFDNQILQIN